MSSLRGLVLSETSSFDARAVANLMLDMAAPRQMPLTNLAIQKLLYFAHGQFLMTTGQPLVNGYFEAWRYGPVHPVVYGAFKESGSRPIEVRATARDYLTGAVRLLSPPIEAAVADQIDRILSSMGRMPIGRLVEISHAPKGPWAAVVNEAGTNAVLGMRISDRLIRERFRFSMVPLQENAPAGEPLEDTPLT